MLLVETRRPQPPPGEEPARQPWEPNWRLWGWVALTVASLAVAETVGGIVGYLLICVALVSVCRAVCVVLPPLDGLRDHRQ
jgi:hypothetical protein